MDDDTDWSLLDFDDGPKKAGAPVPAAPVMQRGTTKGFTVTGTVNVCPKCGKELGRGSHLHVKHCKGEKK